jgi:hypothetical protein
MGEAMSRMNLCQDDTTIRSNRDVGNGGNENMLLHLL